MCLHVIATIHFLFISYVYSPQISLAPCIQFRVVVQFCGTVLWVVVTILCVLFLIILHSYFGTDYTPNYNATGIGIIICRNEWARKIRQKVQLPQIPGRFKRGKRGLLHRHFYISPFLHPGWAHKSHSCKYVSKKRSAQTSTNYDHEENCVICSICSPLSGRPKIKVKMGPPTSYY